MISKFVLCLLDAEKISVGFFYNQFSGAENEHATAYVNVQVPNGFIFDGFNDDLKIVVTPQDGDAVGMFTFSGMSAHY